MTRAVKRGTEIGLFDFNFEPCVGHGIRQLGLNRLQRNVVNGRRLARDAVVIHGIGTVGADFHFPDGVVAFAGYAFDAEANVGQIFGETVVVHREVDEIAKPSGRNFHEISFQLSAWNRPAQIILRILDHNRIKRATDRD